MPNHDSLPEEKNSNVRKRLWSGRGILITDLIGLVIIMVLVTWGFSELDRLYRNLGYEYPRLTQTLISIPGIAYGSLAALTAIFLIKKEHFIEQRWRRRINLIALSGILVAIVILCAAIYIAVIHLKDRLE